MSIKTQDLRQYVVIPCLNDLNLNSDAAINLLLGTAAQESKMGYYLKQVNGPAMGIYQMEKPTHDHLFNKYKSEFKALSSFTGDASDLIDNLKYATYMARLLYYQVPDPLPNANDLLGLAQYYKKYWNTFQGKATTEQFIVNYKELVLNA